VESQNLTSVLYSDKLKLVAKLYSGELDRATISYSIKLIYIALSRIKNRLEGPIAQEKTIKQKIPPWLNVTTQGPLSSMLENIAQNVFFLLT
jgi:hypothetical protein